MLSTPFNRLFIKKQFRSVPKDKEVEAIGYDTETVKGCCALIASPTRHLNPTSIDSILFFLTSKQNRAKIGFFYNLRYDFQSIIKWLPPEYWQEIHTKGKTTYGDFELFYIPRKMFSIKRMTGSKKRVFKFYDISQFYKFKSLKVVAKKYLDMDKGEPDVDIENLTPEICQRQDVIDYCKQDALLCELLAKKWIEICHSKELYPTNFCSPASISVRYFQREAEIPTINWIPKRYVHMAWLACSGAFITVYKRGFFKKVYEYDINSAYPYIMSCLPHLNDGRFYLKKGHPPKEAMLGWLKVKIEVTENDKGFYYPPFPVSRKNLPNFFPCGWFESYITLGEYNAYKNDFEIIPMSGLYWLPKFQLRFPFAEVVKYLFDARKEIEDDNINYFYKICMNGFYGKNLERHLIRDEDHKFYSYFETGNFFNPFYGSYILGMSRVAVYTALKMTPPECAIGCFTDSILSTKPIDLSLGPELGKWEFSRSGELLLVGCGVYTLRNSEEIKTKTRGFHTTNKIDLFEIFRKNKDITELGIKVKRNISFPSAIIQKRTAEMNFLVDDIKKININFDTKRLWMEHFRCAGDLLEKNIDSMPLLYGI